MLGELEEEGGCVYLCVHVSIGACLYVHARVCVCVSACFSDCDQENLKSYKCIFMKLVVNDHHQNITLKSNFEDTP